FGIYRPDSVRSVGTWHEVEFSERTVCERTVAVVLSLCYNPSGSKSTAPVASRTMNLRRLILMSATLSCCLMISACSDPSAQAQAQRETAQPETPKVERFKLLRKLEGHRDIVSALAFSPDGETLASGSHDERVILWNIANTKPPRTLEGHHYWISSL